jgi:protein phosphatase
MNKIPLHSIVLAVGPAKGGKTTWVNQNFQPHEIVSASQIRLELCGDLNNNTVNTQVWDEIARRVELKISMGQRAVIDNTHLKSRDREMFVRLAQKWGVDLIYVPINRDLVSKLSGHDAKNSVIIERSHVLYQNIERELMSGDSVADVLVDLALIEIVEFPGTKPLPSKLLAVGDVHGNFVAMERAVDFATTNNLHIVWLGDVIDYGPHNLRCLRLAYDTVRTGEASMIWGNHERKIDKWVESDCGHTFHGRLSDSNLITIREITSLNDARQARFCAAWTALRGWSYNHIVADHWMFTHGAALPEMWNNHEHRQRGNSSNVAFFGQIDNQNPNHADGYPNRIWDWVHEIPENHTVVVGHDWLDRVNNCYTLKSNPRGGRAIVVDCGSSKGGRLGAVQIDRTINEFLPVYFD